MRDIWAVVPIKALEYAKSRLAPVMEPAVRRALVVEMLRHTLSVLRRCGELQEIVVVSTDPVVGVIAEEHGAVFLPESGAGDLNDALAQAAAFLVEHQAKGMLVIPGDLPQLSPNSIRELVRAATLRGVVIAPDRQGIGTNALLVTPPDAIPFLFGPGSFRRHLAAAEAAGVPSVVVRAPDLAMDADLPEDLGPDLEVDAGTGDRTWLRNALHRLGLEPEERWSGLQRKR